MALFEHSHHPRAPLWCLSQPPFPSHQSTSPLYDVPLYFMAGPTRTDATSHRANPLSSNPPRPPNAWILYRSDKLKDLPPPPPGMPRRPQADISKTISSMWKSEAPDVRAHYERLSDIKKAEHQALYPGYRFQPMKKADKDRIRAEKQAERERERGARKSKAKTRAAPVPPLYTTEARPASVDANPGPSTVQQPPTPPPDHPTPRATTPPAPESPSSYPAPPAPSAITPPLVAPQPGVLQRPPSPSEYQEPPSPQQPQQQQPVQQDTDSLWLSQSFPDFAQEYLSIPLPDNNSQQPLGWSPQDPSPQTDMPFYQPQSDPLHAVVAPTDDPHVFDIINFDDHAPFDGTRDIEITMGTNMVPSAFLDMNQFTALANSLLFDLDQRNSFEPSSLPDPVQHQDTIDTLASYSFESAFENPAPLSPPPAARSPTPTPAPAPAITPYVPPAGAINSSSRRVAADWRHIRLTPESR